MLGALSYVIFQLETTRGSPLDEPQKSSVKHKTLNPTFNEAFTFHLDQGSRPLLSVTVMDRDGLETGEPVRCLPRLHRPGPLEPAVWIPNPAHGWCFVTRFLSVRR
eukprot:COSAG01_NODE_1833_length_9107_cov_7.147313_7_plen_106_part_00